MSQAVNENPTIEEQTALYGKGRRVIDDADECWQCNGEGFIYSCHTEYACIDPEGGCDLCERVCDICFPAKRK